jgi:hypothetical protein
VARTIQIVIPDDLFTGIEHARGQESRSAWCRHAIAQRVSLHDSRWHVTSDDTPFVPGQRLSSAADNANPENW